MDKQEKKVNVLKKSGEIKTLLFDVDICGAMTKVEVSRDVVNNRVLHARASLQYGQNEQNGHPGECASVEYNRIGKSMNASAHGFDSDVDPIDAVSQLLEAVRQGIVE